MSGNRPPLLLLCHRIPYPPNKGDKIRSFHWLAHLSRCYDIFLGAFIDDPNDVAHEAKVREYCRDALLLPLVPWKARVKSLIGFVSGEALSVPYFYDHRMQHWVAEVVGREGIQRALAFSSPMAQYLTRLDDPRESLVVDMVDVDSDKWSQYAARKSWWESWVYRREAHRLAAFEAAVAAGADATVFVSSAEAELFRQRLQDPTICVESVPNGVDTEYFRPDPSLPSPFGASENPVVFTGAMDYWANVDAATWFIRQVLPGLIEQDASIRFYVVGSNPAPELLKLRCDQVVVTGRVPDVRPYLQHACAVVAPMRIARGIQNKVLEGMAMAKPVVTTSLGLEGLTAQPGRHLYVADDAARFAGAVLELLQTDARPDTGAAARELVVSEYGWGAAAGALEALLGTPN